MEIQSISNLNCFAAKVENMLDHLAMNKKAFFRYQMIDEPDLHYDAKKKLAGDLFASNPARFLAIHMKHLQVEDRLCFENLQKSNCEIKYYLKVGFWLI